MITIRKYMPEDWEAVAGIHDEARRVELKLAGLEEAFLPFSIASEQESFFEYPGIFVAELEGIVAGFAACTQEELAWLYVNPACMRKGIGRALFESMLEAYPGLCCIEVLTGNEPAKALYESQGFQVIEIRKGRIQLHFDNENSLWYNKKQMLRNKYCETDVVE